MARCEAVAALARTAARGVDVTSLVERYVGRESLVGRYTAAWRRYCWPVASVADLRLAPFHVLATEGAVHADKDHAWHMEQAAAIAAADDSSVLFTTAHRVVDLTDPASEAAATAWWEEMT